MNLTRSLRVLAATGIVLAGASAVAAGDNPSLRPFWGSVVGEADFSTPGYGTCDDVLGWWEPVLTTANAEGAITHLGRTTYFSTHCPTIYGAAELGTAVFTAANGDEVWATYRADTTVPPPPLVIQEGELVIYGGTGRFENASGHVHMTVYVVYEGLEDPSWPLGIVFAGTIAY